MSRGLNLVTYCAGGAVFHDVAMEARSEVFPGDKVRSALVTKMACRGVVVMLPEDILPQLASFGK
jgi:hypothetical protein